MEQKEIHETDFWPRVQGSLKDFTKDEDKDKIDDLNKNGKRYIKALLLFAAKKDINFYITPRENLTQVSGALNDIWGHELSVERGIHIQIPRHVVNKRETPPQIARAEISFRDEVPPAYILTNMAHEIAHAARNKANPQNYERIFKGKSPQGQSQMINFTPEMIDEETKTDVEAFKLLKNLEVPGNLPFTKKHIPISPEIFVSQIPENAQMPNYRENLLNILKETL